MENLNHAIQLIREGRKKEAQQLLEPLIKSEPANIQAWFWYVETCSTTEKRIQVLEICLKMNPGNSQVIQALQTLHNQKSVQQPAITPPPAQTSKPEPIQVSSPYSVIYDDEQKSSSASSYFDDQPSYAQEVSSTPQQQSSGKQKYSWEVNNDSYIDNSMLSKPKPAVKSYAFYDVWLTALAAMNVESYESVLNDPEAGAGRAFEWIAYAGIISGLLAPFSFVNSPQFAELKNLPQFSGLLGNIGTTTLIVFMALAMALITPILSAIGLAISAGIQNVLALLWGGNGNFGRTAYALAGYLAPMTIIIATLSIVPLIGQCLTSLLGFYNLVLNIRALRAAHSISVGQAIGVVFTPGILVLILGCLFFFMLSPGLSR